MRLSTLALALACSLLISTLSIEPDDSGASTPLDIANSMLIQAFHSVQEADRAGSPREDTSHLIDELNHALAFQEKATELIQAGDLDLANLNAALSMNVSSQVNAQAISLRNSTERRALIDQAVAYSLAIGAAILTALVVMEIHRLPQFLQRRKVLRMRLE